MGKLPDFYILKIPDENNFRTETFQYPNEYSKEDQNFEITLPSKILDYLYQKGVSLCNIRITLNHLIIVPSELIKYNKHKKRSNP
jgi:hypothetical protein